MLLAIGRDEKGSVRPDVLEAITAVEPDGAARFELLFAALRDFDPSVRAVGVNHCARGEPGTALALPVLIELFKVDANLRRSIAQAFGSMGPDAKPVVPMMLELIRNPDTDQNLRRYLINSVRRIDSAAIEPVGK